MGSATEPEGETSISVTTALATNQTPCSCLDSPGRVAPEHLSHPSLFCLGSGFFIISSFLRWPAGPASRCYAFLRGWALDGVLQLRPEGAVWIRRVDLDATARL